VFTIEWSFIEIRAGISVTESRVPVGITSRRR